MGRSPSFWRSYEKTSAVQGEAHGLRILSQITSLAKKADLEILREALEEPAIRAAATSNRWFRAVAPLLDDAALLTQRTLSSRHDKIKRSLPPDSVQIVDEKNGRVSVKTANHGFYAPMTEYLPALSIFPALGVGQRQILSKEGYVTISRSPGRQPQPFGRAIEQSGFYKVQDVEGTEHLAAVFTPLYDLLGNVLPLKLIVSEDHFAVQEKVAGAATNLRLLRSDVQLVPSGWGIFTWREGEKSGATVPVHVLGKVGDSSYLLDGERILSKTAEISKLVSTAEQVYIPAQAEWVALHEKAAEFKQDTGIGPISRVATIRRDKAGSWSLFGRDLDKIAHQFMTEEEAAFLLSLAGVDDCTVRSTVAEAEKVGEAQCYTSRTVRPYEERFAEARGRALGHQVWVERIKANLIKEAAAIPDAATVDALLSLNFVTPENLATLVEYLPSIETAQRHVAEMLLASRIGVTQLPEGALQKAMQHLEVVISALKQLALGSVKET